ncbi:hypothetical protein Cfor_05035 [Coptotermes formosanus]|uniref:Peptidase S1 domain-containing protein n=1 Tax=Coptotermes formosanus TaxID=36987 RepID=A0A6L2PS39_COPFO|nr:hypothetical protein Cfor_05035 [Coptotermes formosanus]
MKSLVFIFGLLVAAVQAASEEGFIAGLTPLNVYVPLIEGAPKIVAPKIVNGYPAVDGQFPHQAAVTIDGSTFCGGSLISTTYVLTAAHCAQGSQYQIVLGRRILNSNDGVSLLTSNKLVHSGYDSDNLRNDLALLRLPSAVTLTTNIKPVNLPSSSQASDTFEGVTAVVSGFGKTSEKKHPHSQTNQGQPRHKNLGINCIPCESDRVYMGQSRHPVATRCKEHMRHLDTR